jgi:vancomycin resistance protein YoaR
MTRQQSILAGLVMSSCFLALALGYWSYEHYRILPVNISVETVSLGGMKREEAALSIQNLIRDLEQQPILISTQANQERSFSPTDLGIRYDGEQTLEDIFSDTSFMAQIFDRSARAEDSSFQYRILVTVDREFLQQQLNDFLLTQEKDYIDAVIKWENQRWFVQPESYGLLLKSGEVERISGELSQHPPTHAAPVRFTAEYEPAPPRLFANDLQVLLRDLQRFVEKPVVIKLDREQTELSLAAEEDWLVVDLSQKTFSLNQNYTEEWVREFSKKMHIAPEKVTMTGIEEVVSEYDGKIFKRALYQGIFAHGREINQEKLLADLIAVLADPNAKRVIDVEADILPPIISSQVDGYHFPELLSTGTSSYRYGNHPQRVTNIKLSLGSFQAVVVEPGAEVSFNRVTGWITQAKGYTETQIIEEGRVKKGVGGGVCQSSSTVYRAVLNAGLPVKERRNHTLDVVYYHEFGYGLDATVYTDSRSDLRFVNDFPNPILINVYADDRRTMAHVEFYGTTDGRKVELTAVPSGDPLLKLWNWKVIWPDREELRTVISRYQLPKEEKQEVNPLEG